MVAISAPELAAYFPGFEENGVNTCRFRNCRHRSEPRCAVIARVEQGEVAVERYRTYLELLDEVEASAVDDRQRSWQD
jgi:ribosome biogenesis GTPase